LPVLRALAQTQADGITDVQKRAIVEYLPERRIVASESAAAMSHRCDARGTMNVNAPSWNGWAFAPE
jgi:hypothetical protein